MKASTIDRVERLRRNYPEDSSRAIARRARVSHVTVCEVIKQSTHRPKQVVGLDGKRRSVRNRKRMASSDRQKTVAAHVGELERLLTYWNDLTPSGRAFLNDQKQRLERAFASAVET